MAYFIYSAHSRIIYLLGLAREGHPGHNAETLKARLLRLERRWPEIANRRPWGTDHY